MSIEVINRVLYDIIGIFLFAIILILAVQIIKYILLFPFKVIKFLFGIFLFIIIIIICIALIYG